MECGQNSDNDDICHQYVTRSGSSVPEVQFLTRRSRGNDDQRQQEDDSQPVSSNQTEGEQTYFQDEVIVIPDAEEVIFKANNLKSNRKVKVDCTEIFKSQNRNTSMNLMELNKTQSIYVSPPYFLSILGFKTCFVIFYMKEESKVS